MPTLHFRFFLSLFAFIGLTLGSCQQDDEPQPQPTSAHQLTTGSWRLDQIKYSGANARVTSGDDIKDRYSLTFRPDGTYSQKLLADNTTYNGTWKLAGDNTVLNLTDHKGTESQYKLASLTTTELRYSFDTPIFETQERIFSAQP